MDTDSLRKTLAIYRGLVEVSGLIGSITEFDELLGAVLDVAKRVMQAEASSLFLVNEEHGELEMVLASNAEGRLLREGIRVPRGKGIAGWVFEHDECVLIPDAYADPRFYREADAKSGFRTRSILCGPLSYEGSLIGVLQVLNPREKPSFEQEDLEGFRAYTNLTATALQKVRALEQLRRQERVNRDLAIASEIQTELLSRAIPEHVPGARFAAFNRPAATVGGDFYDVFVKNPYETYFAIGDVSGKGISASLLMAQVLSAMQFVFTSATSPADALAKLNSTLHQRIVRGMFVTMLIGRFTPASGRIELASAGHCRPYMLRATGRTILVETEGALPLGILPRVAYRQGKIDIASGDHLICFTDGLSESRAQEDDGFFEDRIEGVLKALDAPASPAGIMEALVHAEETHRGPNPRSDDLTLLILGAQ